MQYLITGEESMAKKNYLLIIVIIFVSLMAIISMSTADVVVHEDMGPRSDQIISIANMSTADVADPYGENTNDALSFLSGPRTGLVLSPFIEQAGETFNSPPQIIVMPISVGITIPFSITVNIFCTDPSCTDLAYSYAFDQAGNALDLSYQYSYTYESDGSEFEEYSSNVNFDELFTILFDALSGSEDVDMNVYNNFFDTSFVPDLILAMADDVDIGTLNDQYVELYNKYYGENAEIN